MALEAWEALPTYEDTEGDRGFLLQLEDYEAAPVAPRSEQGAGGSPPPGAPRLVGRSGIQGGVPELGRFDRKARVRAHRAPTSVSLWGGEALVLPSTSGRIPRSGSPGSGSRVADPVSRARGVASRSGIPT